jgi:hypothetical protein
VSTEQLKTTSQSLASPVGGHPAPKSWHGALICSTFLLSYCICTNINATLNIAVTVHPSDVKLPPVHLADDICHRATRDSCSALPIAQHRWRIFEPLLDWSLCKVQRVCIWLEKNIDRIASGDPISHWCYTIQLEVSQVVARLVDYSTEQDRHIYRKRLPDYLSSRDSSRRRCKSVTVDFRLNAAYWSLGHLISRNTLVIYLDATKGPMSGGAETI